MEQRYPKAVFLIFWFLSVHVLGVGWFYACLTCLMVYELFPKKTDISETCKLMQIVSSALCVLNGNTLRMTCLISKVLDRNCSPSPLTFACLGPFFPSSNLSVITMANHSTPSTRMLSGVTFQGGYRWAAHGIHSRFWHFLTHSHGLDSLISWLCLAETCGK